MNSSSTRCRRYWPLRAAAALVAVSQLVMPFTAVAQTPLATTPISSTATATYFDHDGVQQTATSNVVVTYIQQVGAFAVNEGVTKNGLGGNSVAVMHTITNSGNGPDKFQITVQDSIGGNNFASIDAYHDADANGQVDPSTSSLLLGGEVSDGSARSSLDIPLAVGETYTYVVIYKLPTSWTGISNTATVTVKSLNPSLYAVPANSEVAKTDTINLVTGAAFDATFTVAAPVGVSAPPALGGNWGPSPSSGPQGTTTTYTFTFRNNGADDGSPNSGVIYLRGELPANLTYKPNTAVWSTLPGQALPAGVTGSAPNQIEFQVTGQKIEALVNKVAPGSTGTLSFQVEVGSNASSGPLVSNGWHSVGDCPAANLASVATTPACAPTTQNMSATFTVVPTRGVELGDPGLDTLPLSSVRVGSTVKFAPIVVKNTGSGFDTFRLTQEPDATKPFPSGTVFTWYQQGGAIPLQPTSGAPDSVETPQVDKGGTVNVELHAVLPPGTAVAAGVNYTVKATATSMGDSSKSDALNLVLNDVADPLVDLTSTQTGSASDIGLGKYLNTVSDALLSVTAGGAGHTAAGEINALAGRAVYHLHIKNRDTGSLTFSLESSATPSFPGNLPAGWGVQYHKYDDSSVTTSLNTAALVPQEILVPANGQGHVLAVVTPPANTSDVANQDLYFRVRATSAGGTVLDDQIRTQLSVVSSNTRGFMLSPTGGSRQVGQGGVTFFAHTLRNTGTQTCGDTTNQLKVTATITPGQTGSNAWNVTLYKDNGTQGQFDSSDVPMSSGDMLVKLLPGAEQPLIVRVQAPSGGVPGSSVNVTLTVEDQDGPATSCGTQTVADTASVAVGQLVVNKLQRLDPGCNNAAPLPFASTTISNAKPGECIEYRSTVTNNGSSVVTNVTLHDGVPPFTTYHNTPPVVSCTATGLSTAPTLTNPAPGGTGPLTCGNTTNTLNSTGEIQLQFRVRINP
jgi:uncharacterized repeat protein (TIGR01451 family)